MNRARDIYRDELVSIILYGSAASGEFSARHSNVNIAVILRDTSLANLSRIAPLLNKYKFRPLKVIFFTEIYIKNSADVFPIEFLDIKENHKILYGSDLLAGLKIDIKNLRFQCEQELKSKILSVNGIAAEFHIDISDMKKILAAKTAGRRLPRKDAAALFNSFVNDLEKISDIVDGL